jgi:benzodiazapine receptor
MAIQYELWGGKASYRNTNGMQIGALIGWLALTFCAAATGVFVKTGGWYADLIKPTWNPPSWVFGPVWTALYIMMAVAAWLVWREGGWKMQRGPLTLYLIQLLLNAIWTPLFFALHQPGWAFAEILILLAAILTTTLLFWRVRRSAALLLMPYVLWTTFAAVLNFTIWRLNA